ncbi:unnamed protein product, partial [Staurois parvus]
GAPLVSVGGVVPHHWYQWEESCPIIGVSGRNSTPSLEYHTEIAYHIEIKSDVFSFLFVQRCCCNHICWLQQYRTRTGVSKCHWCQWEE